jgi:hypothetical protein
MRHRTLMAVNLLETAVPTMRSQCTGVHSGFLDRTHTAVRLESLTYSRRTSRQTISRSSRK